MIGYVKTIGSFPEGGVWRATRNFSRFCEGVEGRVFEVARQMATEFSTLLEQKRRPLRRMGGEISLERAYSALRERAIPL
jgi:hypothetical protein